MNALALAAIAALGLLSFSGARKKEPTDMVRPPKPDFVRMRQLIRAEALRQGVPVDVALATARVESNFDSSAPGDLNWHKNAARFEANVPASSPYRNQPELWHSYGLFQLLAPYHVKGDEDPRILFDPQVNAERGIAFLRRLLLAHHGDLNKVRLYYTGAHRADEAIKTKVLAKWANALAAERALL